MTVLREDTRITLSEQEMIDIAEDLLYKHPESYKAAAISPLDVLMRLGYLHEHDSSNYHKIIDKKEDDLF